MIERSREFDDAIGVRAIDLVAARRPTVTKALGELAAREAVVWTGTDWHLPGEPPAELDALGSLSIADAA